LTATIAGRRLSPATLVGLALALAGPFLIYLALQPIFGQALSVARIALGTGLHWLNLALLLYVVVGLERQPMASIGVRPLRWWTAPLGLIAGVVITLASGLLVGVLHLSADKTFVGFLQSLGLFVRILVAVTAGVYEETLYRGYALERLASLWGSRWLAGAATLVLFTLMHAPAVGWSHLLSVALTGAMVTLLYLWRRNLVVNIIAHVTVDAIGLLAAPLLAH
jgi:membrane protease YdiL (CAAX protease family)